MTEDHFERFTAKYTRYHGITVRRSSIDLSVSVQRLLRSLSLVTVEYDTDHQAIRLSPAPAGAACDGNAIYKVSRGKYIGAALHQVMPTGRYEFAATTVDGWLFRLPKKEVKRA